MNTILKNSLWLKIGIALFAVATFFPLLSLAQTSGSSGGSSGSGIISPGTICPADAKQCSDGSWVGRSGPNCEFVCTPPDQPALSAHPSSGKAPLLVSFSYFLGSNTNTLTYYRIDFGDGTKGTLEVGCGNVGANAEACPRALVASHTYKTAGTYTAHLMFEMCPSDEGQIHACMAPVQLIASTKVTVLGSGTVNETFSASPTKGAAPLTVKFSSALTDTEGYAIDFGDGTIGEYKVCAESYPLQCSISHTYHAAGVYQATLVKDMCPPGSMCFAAARAVGKVTITVGQTSVSDDVITNEDEQSVGEIETEVSSHTWFSWIIPFFTFSWLPFW